MDDVMRRLTFSFVSIISINPEIVQVNQINERDTIIVELRYDFNISSVNQSNFD